MNNREQKIDQIIETILDVFDDKSTEFILATCSARIVEEFDDISTWDAYEMAVNYMRKQSEQEMRGET